MEYIARNFALYVQIFQIFKEASSQCQQSAAEQHKKAINNAKCTPLIASGRGLGALQSILVAPTIDGLKKRLVSRLSKTK
jgi:hypothetical protein